MKTTIQEITISKSQRREEIAAFREQAARIAALEDAMRSMREHLAIQPSALAKALVATIDAALTPAPAPEGE